MIRDLRRILSMRARRDAPAEPRSDVTAHAGHGRANDPKSVGVRAAGEQHDLSQAILRAEE